MSVPTAGRSAERVPGVLGVTFTRIAARGAASVMQAVTLVLLARAMHPAAFGTYAIGYSLTLIGTSVAGLGAQYHVLRLKMAADGERLRRGLSALTGLLIGVMVVVASIGVAAGAAPFAVYLGVLAAATDQVGSFLQNLQAGRSRPRAASAIAVAPRVLPLVAVALALVDSAGTTGSYLIAVLVDLLVLYAGLIIVGITRSCTATDALAAVRASRDYVSLASTITLNQLESPIVGVVSSTATAGLYAAAVRLTGPFSIVSSTLSSVFTPQLAAAGTRASFAALSRRLLIATSVYGAVLILAAWPCALLAVQVLGPRYAPATLVFVGVVAAAGLSAVGQTSLSQLLALGRPAKASVALLLSSVVDLAALAVLGASNLPNLLALPPLLTQVVFLAISFPAARAARAGHFERVT